MQNALRLPRVLFAGIIRSEVMFKKSYNKCIKQNVQLNIRRLFYEYHNKNIGTKNIICKLSLSSACSHFVWITVRLQPCPPLRFGQPAICLAGALFLHLILLLVPYRTNSSIRRFITECSSERHTLI